MNLSSNLFGLSGTGNIDLTMNMVKSKGKTYTKITTANSGLFHLLHIFSTADEPVFTPKTFELYNDGTQIYVKGEALIHILLLEYGYEMYSYFYADEIHDLADKWFSVEQLPASLALLSGDTTIGEYIVKLSFESESFTSTPLDYIDMLTALFADENVAVSEHDGLKTYTYTIDKDMYLRCMEPLLSGLSSGERTDFDNVMNGFEMSISVTQHVSEDGITAVSDGKISLSNVPNPWNEDVFSGEILFSFDEQADFSVSSDFVFPDVSDAVNLLDYMRDLVDADIFAR